MKNSLDLFLLLQTELQTLHENYTEIAALLDLQEKTKSYSGHCSEAAIILIENLQKTVQVLEKEIKNLLEMIG